MGFSYWIVVAHFYETIVGVGCQGCWVAREVVDDYLGHGLDGKLPSVRLLHSHKALLGTLELEV